MRLFSKNSRIKQLGFSAVEVIIVIVVIGILVLVGMRVANKQNDTADNTAVPVTEQQDEIKNTQDLNEAEKNLNETNIDELDTTELDAAEAELL